MKNLISIAAVALIVASCGTSRNISYQKVATFPDINQENRIAVVAHRGFWKAESAGKSQNSIEALAAAQKEGFWGSECDIHLTKDGEIIVNHDATIDGLKISDHLYMTLAKHLLPNGQPRPTFKEYLAQAKKHSKTTVLIVEFKKQGSREAEDALVEKAFDQLRSAHLFDPSKVAFISFSHHICQKIAKEAPKFTNCYLSGDIAPSKLALEGINGIDYQFKKLVANPSWVKEAKELGMSVWSWTVNKREDIMKMIELGVHGITTNEPLLVRDILGSKELRK